MVTTDGAQRTGQLAGIICLLLAVSFGAASDAISKILIDQMPIGIILVARYLPALLFIVLMQKPANTAALFRTTMPKLQLARGVCPLLISAFLILAFTRLPLADGTVLLFAGPLIVVLMSGVLLGERVNSSIWLGVAVGFVGVVIVVRPGFASFSSYSILPAAAAVFFALFQLLSRQLGKAGQAPATTTAWTMLTGTLASLPFAVVQWVAPGASQWLQLLALGAVFGASHLLFARAFALAPASLLAPFGYFQIVAAVAFGLILFGDVPDGWTTLGILTITGAGLYVSRRGTT